MFPPWVVVLAALALGGCGGGGKGASTTAPERTPAAAAPRSPAAAPRPVTRAAVLRWLEGKRIQVDGRRVRIDRTTLTCAGVGRSSRRRGKRAWTRFRCVQPTFPPGSLVGPDAILFVEPAGNGMLAVVDANFARY